MAAPKLSVRISDSVQASLARLQLEQGISQSEAGRILLELGAARAGELPDGWFMGYRQGIEDGRRNVFAVVLAKVRDGLRDLV